VDVSLFLWGSKKCSFLDSALHYIHIRWFTYVVANIEVQFAGCGLDLSIQ